MRFFVLVLCGAVGCTGSPSSKSPAQSERPGSGDAGSGSSDGESDSGTPRDTANSADSGDTASPSWSEPTCAPISLTQRQVWDNTATPLVGGWGAAAGDLDGDGFDDLVLATRGATRVLAGGPDGLALVEPGTTTGDRLPPGSAAALADLDDDGDLDAFIGTEPDQPDLLLFNDGNFRFRVEALPDSDGFAGHGIFADIDGNGRLDLVVGRRLSAGTTIEAILDEGLPGDPSSLYLQTAPGVFEDASDRLPTSLHDAHTQAVGALDVDTDGDLDLYFANDFGPYIVPNMLLVNDGTGHFTLSDDCFCDLSHFGMSASVADYDRDGHPDLYVTDIGGPELLHNFGDGTFYDATVARSASIPAAEDQLVAWGATPLDLNRDGWVDLPVAFGVIAEVQQESVGELNSEWTWSDNQRDALLMGGPDGFTRVAPEQGFDDPSDHRVVVAGDFDGDGRDELVLAGLLHTTYWDVAGGCDHALRVSLDAGPGNHQGIGARIDVTRHGSTRTAWMLPATTGSASAPAVTIGLGEESMVDVLTVTWPDGTATTLEDVPAGAVRVAR